MPPSPTIVTTAAAVAALALSSSALAWAPQSAELYQWKDAQGVTHYSQTPPDRGERYQQRQISHAQRTAGQPQAGDNGTSTQSGQESAPCKSARSNIAALSSDGPVRGATAEDGKPGEVLSASQRANQLALAQAAVKAYCSSPNT